MTSNHRPTGDWRAVRAAIEAETRAIWSVEPDDIKRLRHGITIAQAGSFGQYFSTLVFALTYTLTMGEHVVYGLVKGADNPDVPVKALNELTREHFGSGFQAPGFLGYVLAPNAEHFANDILAVLDQIETPEDFKALLGSYFTYLNILHWWLHIYFPWSLGSVFQQVDATTITELGRLVKPAGETK